jgi:hypothetical protein
LALVRKPSETIPDVLWQRAHPRALKMVILIFSWQTVQNLRTGGKVGSYQRLGVGFASLVWAIGVLAAYRLTWACRVAMRAGHSNRENVSQDMSFAESPGKVCLDWKAKSDETPSNRNISQQTASPRAGNLYCITA